MKENISINNTKFNQVRTKLMKKKISFSHTPHLKIKMIILEEEELRILIKIYSYCSVIDFLSDSFI